MKQGKHHLVHHIPRRQGGALFMEVLMVLVIAAILAALASPGMRSVMVGNDLSSAQDTMIQTLRKARYLARSQGTPVTVRLEAGAHIVELQTRDNMLQERVSLPRRVTVANDLDLVFNPVGTVSGSGNIALVMGGGTDQGERRNLTVSALGALAAN